MTARDFRRLMVLTVLVTFLGTMLSEVVRGLSGPPATPPEDDPVTEEHGPPRHTIAVAVHRLWTALGALPVIAPLRP